MNIQNNILRLCRVLNKNKVKYIITGGYACSLNGHIRATEDIDVLLKDDDVNIERVIKSINEIFPDIKETINIKDIRDNVVLKIMDDFEVDFSIKAWTVDYTEADKDKKITTIEGVEIPYMGIDILIKSKDTYREIDKWDVKILSEIKKSKY